MNRFLSIAILLTIFLVDVTAVYVGNGFGKAVGFTQIQELGELETPIALTNTLSVYDVAAALADYMLQLPGNEGVRSVNAVVGETNDGWLNDIRARVVSKSELNLKVIHFLEEDVPEEEGFEEGFITHEHIERYLPNDENRYSYYTCGPAPLMNIAEKSLRDMGVDWRRIIPERFDII